MYASELKSVSALNLNQNPIFESAFKIALKYEHNGLHLILNEHRYQCSIVDTPILLRERGIILFVSETWLDGEME